MEQSNNSSARGDSSLIFTALLLFGALVYYLSYLNHGIVQTDEGSLLVTVERMMRGEVWFIDYFSPYNPMRFWPLALLFKLTGVTMAAFRMYFVVIRLLGLALMIAIGLRLMSARWVLLAVLPAVLVPSHMFKSILLLWPMLVLWLTFRSWESRRLVWPFLLGVGAGFAFWVRAEMVVIFAVLSFFSLEVDHWTQGSTAGERWARRGALALGLALAIGSLWPFYPGVTVNLVHWTRFTFGGAAMKLGIPWPSFLGAKGGANAIARFIFFWAVLLVYAGTAIDLALEFFRGRRSDGWERRLILLAMGSAFLYNAILQSNLPHFLQVAAPAYLLMVNVFCRINRGTGRFSIKVFSTAAPVVLIGMLIIYAFFFTGLAGVGGIALRRTMDVPIHSPLGTVYFHSPRAEQFQEVINYIQANTESDDFITVVPDALLLSVMANRPSTGALIPMYPGSSRVVGSENMELIIRSVKRAELIVYFERPTQLEHHRPRERRFMHYLHDVYEMILDNYTFEKRVGDYVILRKGTDPSGATRAFIEGWEAYKYGMWDEARDNLIKAISMGAPEAEIAPLLKKISTIHPKSQ